MKWLREVIERRWLSRSEPSFVIEFRPDVDPEENAEFREVLERARRERWTPWAIRFVARMYGYRVTKR